MDAGILAAWAAILGVVIAIVTLAIQNRQAHFTSSIELLLHFEERFESDEFRRKRKQAAAALLGGKTDQADDVLDFFEMVGLLIRQRALNETMVWHAFGRWALLYHHAALPTMEKKKEEDSSAWTELCYLFERMKDLELRHRGATNLDYFTARETTMLTAETLLPCADA
jgi:hypothetical protein